MQQCNTNLIPVVFISGKHRLLPFINTILNQLQKEISIVVFSDESNATAVAHAFTGDF